MYHRENNILHLQVLEVLLSHEADINVRTPEGLRITDYNYYWRLETRFHQIIIQQDLYIPDLGEVIRRESGDQPQYQPITISYTNNMRDSVIFYIQAGSRAPFAIRSVVAMNSLKWDMEELDLAYHANSKVYREIGRCMIISRLSTMVSIDYYNFPFKKPRSAEW